MTTKKELEAQVKAIGKSPALQEAYAKQREEYTKALLIKTRKPRKKKPSNKDKEQMKHLKPDDPIAIYQEMNAQWNGA